MSDNVRYWKPNMTNLPYELGKEIFSQILSTPAPDHKKMQEESARLVREMLKERAFAVRSRGQAPWTN